MRRSTRPSIRLLETGRQLARFQDGPVAAPDGEVAICGHAGPARTRRTRQLELSQKLLATRRPEWGRGAVEILGEHPGRRSAGAFVRRGPPQLGRMKALERRVEVVGRGVEIVVDIGETAHARLQVE